MKVIATIDNEKIVELDDSTVTYQAKFAVDADGSGSSHRDPDFQNDTSLHLSVGPLNSDTDKYIVVPPAIINGVKGIVLGCQAFVTNLSNGRTSDAVVGDIGPKKKIGEGSIALAEALGINPSPIRGGVDSHIIHYSIRPGVPASVDGKKYALQKS